MEDDAPYVPPAKKATDYANETLAVYAKTHALAANSPLHALVADAIEAAYQRGQRAAYKDAVGVLCDVMPGQWKLLEEIEYVLESRAAMGPYAGEDE